jgi:hypothetical protein
MSESHRGVIDNMEQVVAVLEIYQSKANDCLAEEAIVFLMDRIKELEAQLETEVSSAKRLIKAAVAIYESGAVTYMSDSEEDFQREVFGAMQEYLEKYGDKNDK